MIPHNWVVEDKYCIEIEEVLRAMFGVGKLDQAKICAIIGANLICDRTAKKVGPADLNADHARAGVQAFSASMMQVLQDRFRRAP